MPDPAYNDQDVATIRQHAAQVLERLEQEATDNDTTIPSWIGTPFATTSVTARLFHHAGFVKLPSFCSMDECRAMKASMAHLVEHDCDDVHQLDSFGTSDAENAQRGDYFLASATRIHYFCEPAAMHNDNGPQLRPEFRPENNAAMKMTSLNKAGHALHLRQTTPFYTYATSTKLRHLVTSLGWTDPVVPQSMYIFKQAHHGGVVTSHQDSTFLYTTPRPTCLGLWLALDDATMHNGCLWVRPYSHHEQVRRQYCRNIAHFGEQAITCRSNDAGGDATQPKLVMQTLVVPDHHHTVPWEGHVPDGDWPGAMQVGFVPVECRAGDLLCFPGTLDHYSYANTSENARHTFQLHLVEGPKAGISWSPFNWLQYPNGMSFLRLNNP